MVYKNKNKYFHARVIDGKQKHCPVRNTLQEACEDKCTLDLAVKNKNIDAVIAEMHMQNNYDKRSFYEVKGGGFQLRLFPRLSNMPVYATAEEAHEHGWMLNQIKQKEGEKAAEAMAKKWKDELEREKLNVDEFFAQADSGTVAPSDSKTLIILCDVCAPEEEINRTKMTGKLKVKLGAHLSSGFDVHHVTCRDCSCDTSDGLCLNYTGEDDREARRRVLAKLNELKNENAFVQPKVVLFGRTFRPLAKTMNEENIPFCFCWHPSRFITHKYSDLSAQQLNTFLGQEAFTGLQLFRWARESASDKQELKFFNKL